MFRTLRDAIIAIIVERSVNWLVPNALPYAWTAIALWLTMDVLGWAGVRDRVSHAYSSRSQLVIYLAAFLIGGVAFCLYLFGSKKLFTFAVERGAIKTEETRNPSPTPSTAPPSTPQTSPVAPNDLRLSVTATVLEKGETLRVTVAFRNAGLDEGRYSVMVSFLGSNPIQTPFGLVVPGPKVTRILKYRAMESRSSLTKPQFFVKYSTSCHLSASDSGF